MASPTDLTALLGHTRWLRALARSLAADPHGAEDLAQDAWVLALERPPDLDRPVRGWFATLLRHRWRDVQRGLARQRRRELAAARPEAWPSAHEVVEKAALQRRLVEAVLELDEPYRTTVLLRFFEELPQREIARRMGISTATVNSRLGRGLARLRQRFPGGSSSWLTAVTLLLRPPPVPVLGASGVLAMKAILTSLVFAGAVLGLVLWHANARVDVSVGAPRLETTAVDASARSHDSGSGAAVPTSPASAPARAPVVSPDVQARAVLAAPLAVKTVRGRVLDATGRAVPGIRLAPSPKSAKATCTSDADGWFEIALDAPSETIVSSDPRYATVLAASARVHDETKTIVVVAPRIDLGGVVVGEPRAPLGDVDVELRLPPGFGASFGVALDFSVPQRWRDRSGSDGRFSLAAVPAVEGSAIHAVLAGFTPASLAAPAVGTSSLEIVLLRPLASRGLVRGVVLDATGARCEGARVSAGGEIAVSDALGSFTLDVRGDGAAGRLVALKSGSLPGVFTPEKGADGRPLWPADVVLQLGGTAGVLTGRVVDDDDRPVAGASVWLDDPTPFGRSQDARLVAESVLRGDERFWSREVTASDGSFTIGGLLERLYRVQAMDPRTLVSVDTTARSGASPLVLRLPTRDVHARVAGRVVSRSREPIAGVTVRLFRVTYEHAHADGVDNECMESVPVVTRADGAFEFRDVPTHGVQVIATGDTVLAAAADVEQEADVRRIEIVVERRLHLQVELAAPGGRADALRVFTAEGERVLLRAFHGGGAHADFEMPVLEGRSAVLAVDEDAATLVLLRAGDEVARLPLHLAPGITNRVRF